MGALRVQIEKVRCGKWQTSAEKPGVSVKFLQVEKSSDILAADKLLFPGVGAFEQAMGALKDRGYVEALQEYIQVKDCVEVLYSHIYPHYPFCYESATILDPLCACHSGKTEI